MSITSDSEVDKTFETLKREDFSSLYNRLIEENIIFKPVDKPQSYGYAFKYFTLQFQEALKHTGWTREDFVKENRKRFDERHRQNL